MKSYNNFNKQNQNQLLVGLFYKYSSAMRAHHKLLASGYCKHDISIVMTTDTWKKYFLNTLQNAHDVDNATIRAHTKQEEVVPWENASEINALLGRAHIIPGFDLLVAGPLGQQLSAPARRGISRGILGAFQKWGLPLNLSIQYEEVVFCGGIMIGVRVEPGINNRCIASHWSDYQGTHVHLL